MRVSNSEFLPYSYCYSLHHLFSMIYLDNFLHFITMIFFISVHLDIEQVIRAESRKKDKNKNLFSFLRPPPPGGPKKKKQNNFMGPSNTRELHIYREAMLHRVVLQHTWESFKLLIWWVPIHGNPLNQRLLKMVHQLWISTAFQFFLNKREKYDQILLVLLSKLAGLEISKNIMENKKGL